MCCSVEIKKNYPKELEKHFDEVLVFHGPRYQRLIVRDKVNNKGAIKYSTWLDLKINYYNNVAYYKYSAFANSGEIMEYAIKKVFEIAKEIKRHIEPFQRGLFEDEESKENLIYKLSEKLNDWIWKYNGIEYRQHIPSPVELRDTIKLYLKKVANKEIELDNRFRTIKDYRDDFIWFPNFLHILDGEAKSDLDILEWLGWIRIFVKDRSGNDLFYFQNEEFDACFPLDWDKSILPNYKRIVYTKELIDYVRNLFDIPYREPFGDSYAIKMAIKDYIESCALKKGIDWKDTLGNSRDYKEFMKKIRIKEQSGECGGIGFDGYSVSYDFSKEEISIQQKVSCRLFLQSKNNHLYFHNESFYNIATYKQEEIFRLAYELLKEDVVNYKQMTIFDYL
ncbi:hypothetical protein [Nitrosophilus labii]|uniref:hypothetical protein n=1 Tax=Nitrosophilus labii TaxID=2706014 RepID=UPI0016570B9B|nr:hypothetical protein [Nitrosophilus labii]